MKIKSILIYFILIVYTCTSLHVEKTDTEPWSYNINVELKDSSLFVSLNINVREAVAGQNDYFLFNRYIKINEALLDDTPLTYWRSNDTLYFKSFEKGERTIFMQYEIPYSMTESSRVVSSYSNNIYTYPILFDTSQIFCERFNKWYPVLYDHFANYKVTIIVPKTHQVFAYYPESNCKEIDSKMNYSFSCYDEDFPFFITPINIFYQHKVIQNNNISFEFFFLPRHRRLVSMNENKPVFVSDSTQIDSLLSFSINRSIAAIEWYNANLWQKEIKTLSFVETGILGLGAGVGSFIVMDRMLMNMEAIDQFAISHELSHIWLGIHTEYLAKGKFFIGESIPEYINLLYYESWAGNDAFEKAIQEKIKLTLFDVPFYTVTFEQVLNQRKGDSHADEIIYHKGVAFVHEFQKMIGREKLLKIVRETYSSPNHLVTLIDFENRVKANDCWNEYLKLYEIEL